MRAALVLVSVFGLAALATADDAIPAKTLQELKQGTVYLRVKAGAVSGSGSGFLIHRDENTGYIITNSHVVHLPQAGAEVPASSIEAVFFSGTREETSYQAKVIANLPDEDLALLRVQARSLPAPLKLSSAADLTETMSVYCLGFPFGDLLAVDNQNPALTIAKGLVSSLRMNREGELTGVQIDGALNPGNSGGPVVDKEGRVIGVAVKAVRGAQIGLAIPVAEVAKVLNGRPLNTRVQVAGADDGGVDIALEVTLVDPFNRVRAVTAHYLPEGAAKEKPAIGQFKPLAGTSKIDLVLNGAKATGSFRLPESRQASCWLQIGYQGGDGDDRFLSLMALRLDAQGRPYLVRYEIPSNLARLKGANLSIHFTLGDPGLRHRAAQEIKDRVGNPLVRSGTFTSGAQATVEVFPVNDPRGFLERLQELGRITRVDGPNVYLTITELPPAFAKAPLPKIEPDKKFPSGGGVAKGGAPKKQEPPMLGDAPLWTMDLAKMEFPDQPAAGKLFGDAFTVTQVGFNNIVFTLQDADRTITIFHGVKAGEGIAGKSYHIQPGNQPVQGMRSVHLRRSVPGGRLPETTTCRTYAMKLEFGDSEEGRIPGKIYLCLNDGVQSVVAGTFAVDLNARPGLAKPLPAQPPKVADAPPPMPGDAPLWTMDLAKMEFPDRPAAGKLFGEVFTVEEAKLSSLTLTLRQGQDFFPDLAITIFHRIKAGEGISGKTYEIAAGAPGRDTPSIHLKRRIAGQNLPTGNAFSSNYAMRLEFGQLQDGVVPGQIYLCLPDAAQSVVAGSFIVRLK